MAETDKNGLGQPLSADSSTTGAESTWILTIHGWLWTVHLHIRILPMAIVLVLSLHSAGTRLVGGNTWEAVLPGPT